MSAAAPRRWLIEHAHQPGDISGVVAYVTAVGEALEEKGDLVTIADSSYSILEKIRLARDHDVVHLNSNDLWLLLASKLLGRTVILKLHYLTYQSLHFTYEEVPFGDRIRLELKLLWSKYWPRQPRMLLEAMARLILRLAAIRMSTRVVACSQFLADSASVPGRQVEVLPNPIPSELLRQQGRHETEQSVDFVFVGRLTRDKGCDLLLQAAVDLAQSGPSVRILIVGDGEQRLDLERMSKEHPGLSVTFAGQVPHDEVTRYIRSAAILVQPARWQEPAGYTPLEAAVLGVPTIVAEVGGLPETAGPDALYFEREDVNGLAQQLAYAMANPSEMRERGKRARERSTKMFSAEVVAEQLTHVAACC